MRFSSIYPMNPDNAAPARKPNSAFSRIYPVNPDTAAASAPKPNSAFPRIYPMNPGTTAAPTPNPDSAFPRIYPLNPDNAAPARKPNSAFSRIYPVNPETAAPSQPTRLTPTKAKALCSTTLANTSDGTLLATLEQRFGPAPSPPGWFVPQAWPPPPGVQRRPHSRRDPLAAFLGFPRHATAPP
jgi:hypothetical protein